MIEADIPVDLFNPGQVFACLGFLEAANVLVGDAEGGFDWSDQSNVRFQLRTESDENPFEAVLAFLTEADVMRVGPIGYHEPTNKNGNKDEQNNKLYLSETFPGKQGDKMALPIRLVASNNQVVEIDHWADSSSRENFKLYAGNRSANKIAIAMLKGVRKQPTKKQKENKQRGNIIAKGLTQLWNEDGASLIERPFHVLTPIGGSFNFDPRGAWTAIDAGFSPNDQNIAVGASPVVELLAAWGLENSRPEILKNRQVSYAVWGIALPPALARAALAGGISSLPMKHFHFKLISSGKNKIITFSQQEAY